MESSESILVTLRPYALSDLNEIHRWKNDAETTRWMGPRFRQPISLDDARQSLERALATPSSQARFFVIAEASTGRYLGGIDLTSLDESSGTGVLSVVVARSEERGRGVARQAIGQLAAWAFGDLGLQRITLRVAEANEAAVRCYLACGFRVDGESGGFLTMVLERS